MKPTEALARVDELIERLERDGVMTASSDGTRHELFPVAIPPDEGQALQQWVERERPTAAIEIGLGYAMSTLHIVRGLLGVGDERRHVAIDPYQAGRYSDCGLEVLARAGVDEIVEFHAEESQFALPRLLEEGHTFDFAFVDGNHRFDGVFVDLAYLGRLLRPGSVVFVDDYQLPGVARAVEFFVTNLTWSIEDVSPRDEHHQWAVVRTSRVPDSRPFDYFVDFGAPDHSRASNP